MADTYPNFASLEQHERAGLDYRFLVRRADGAFAIVETSVARSGARTRSPEQQACRSPYRGRCGVTLAVP